MSGVAAPGSPAPSGLLGLLGWWVRTWSSEVSQVPEDLPRETGLPHAHSYGSVRVLVVDDNPVNLTVISARLESRGLVPWLAADGSEAVVLACELQFDLILMDLQMPIFYGLEATSAIRHPTLRELGLAARRPSRRLQQHVAECERTGEARYKRQPEKAV